MESNTLMNGYQILTVNKDTSNLMHLIIVQKIIRIIISFAFFFFFFFNILYNLNFKITFVRNKKVFQYFNEFLYHQSEGLETERHLPSLCSNK
jgi:hypothetical protein